MLWRALYCLATWLALPGALLYFVWRSRREPAYRGHLAERLGWVSERVDQPIWLHAASVGEVVLIAPLVAAIQARWPSSVLLVTTMTPTGRAEAQRRFGQDVALAYVPLDTRGATRRFVRRAGPKMAIFAETELWPNLIAATARRRVPLVLVSATLSARSAARFEHWALVRAARFMLSRFCFIAAASPEHAQRLIDLGASAHTTRDTGNLKYDQPLPPDQSVHAQTLRREWQAETRPLWVAASTHDGEEVALLRVFGELRKTQPDVLWVLAPRHPQRFDEIARLLSVSGWRIARRSRNETVDTHTDIVLADTLGDVPLFYAAADVAFVGGSLVPGIGGHNVIEAAAASCVLATGPWVREWQSTIDDLVAAGAAVVLDSEAALGVQLGSWLADRALCETWGRAGARLVASRRGALAQIMNGLAALPSAPR